MTCIAGLSPPVTGAAHPAGCRTCGPPPTPRASTEPPASSAGPLASAPPGARGPALLTPHPGSCLSAAALSSPAALRHQAPLTKETMEPSSWGITDLSVGACHHGGWRRAGGQGCAEEWAGRPGQDWEACHPAEAPWGCAWPPVRGAWPKSVGQPRGARQQCPSSDSEQASQGRHLARVPHKHLGLLAASAKAVSLTGGPARREQRGDYLSLAIIRTEVTKVPHMSLQSAVNVCLECRRAWPLE